MTNTPPPFAIRHARFLLIPAMLNFYFGFILWRRDVAMVGAVMAVIIPLAVLICPYWTLRDGYFYDSKREEGDPERRIAFDTSPKRYWTIVVLCAVIYSGMTFLTGIAAITGTGR